MRTLKFNLTTTSKPLSMLIRAFQRLDFSHCALEFDSPYLEATLIYEAKGLSSYVINKNHFDGKIVHSYEVDVTPDEFYEVMKYVYGEAGTPYAWKTLIGFIYVMLCRGVGLKVRNPWPHHGKVCSESLGVIMVRYFAVTPDISYDDMDLVWIKEKLDSHPRIKKVEIA